MLITNYSLVHSEMVQSFLRWVGTENWGSDLRRTLFRENTQWSKLMTGDSYIRPYKVRIILRQLTECCLSNLHYLRLVGRSRFYDRIGKEQRYCVSI